MNSFIKTIAYCGTLWMILAGSTFCTYGKSFKFQNFTTVDGLSHKTINCFLKDKKGYVWIGTTNGLNRFDGYRFKSYFFNPDDSLSLGGNIIYEMVEDRNGIFWLSTDAGFYSFNQKDESFHKISIQGINTFKAQTFCADDFGNLWVLVGDTHLVSINSQTYRVNQRIGIDSLLKNKSLGAYSNIQCFEGYIWICSSTGVVRFDFKNNTAKKIHSVDGTLHTFSASFIKKADSKNNVIVIDAKNGIYKIDAKTLHYKCIPLNSFKSATFDLFTITDAEYDNEGGLWVTAIPGLFYISPQGKVSRVNPSVESSHDFDRIMSTCMYKDSDGNLWIGTLNHGVFVFSSKKSAFHHITANLGTQKELPIGGIVTANNKVYASNINAAYALTKESNTENAIFSAIHAAPIMALSVNANKDLYFFKKDKVLKYNESTKAVQEVLQIPSLVHYGMVDSHGVYWACYWGWGIEGFDIKLQKRYKIDIDTNNRRRNVVYRMCEDADGSLWLAMFGAGLVHVQNPRSSSPKLSVYSHIEGRNSIGHDVVLCIHDDGRGSIWLGTNGGGLNRFDKKTKQFEVFNLRNGLKNNVIEAVNSDLEGNIWFASTVMSKYDIREKKISNYDMSDGVMSQYFTGASSRSDDGILYFGDDKGVLMFNPRNIPQEKPSRVPSFTDVKIFGQTICPREHFGEDVPFPESIDYTKRIELPHYLNSFTLEFASIQVLENKNIEYSYMLEGIDLRWIFASAGDRAAKYSGLQAGTYTFKVRSLNGTKKWSEPRTLLVTILPPWWKSVWFRVLFSVLLVSGISLLLFYRIRSLNRKNIRLEKLVKERTLELEQKSEVLNQQTISLQESNSELQEKQVVIEMKNSQLEEALRSKDKLIGVIAHDFKNPLSAVEGLSALLFERFDQLNSSKIRSYIGGIHDASQSLQKQMLSVLEWAQSQVQDMVYRPVEINIETIIDDAILLVKESVTQKEISVSTQLDYQTTAFIDPRMISTVVRNLLTNAIKFTPRNGTITVVVQEYDTGLEVNVIDSGVGISADTLRVLLSDKNIQSSHGTESEKGIGLGLQICKTYIEQNGGTISVKSKLGEGSVFGITIPKGKQAASRKHIEPVVATNQPEIPELSIEVDKTQTVLIIDDNVNLVAFLKAAFEPYYSVVTAPDGENGLQLAQNIIPQLIISDITMPHKSGIELCRVLKSDEMTNHIPIILLTAEKDPNYWREAYKSGVNDLIEKPCDIKLLHEKVKYLLENSAKIASQNQSKTDVKGFILPESYDDAIIRRVLEYINEHFCDSEFEVNTVADAIGMSRTQLWRKFKSTTGHNLSNYIHNLRMEKAKEMLLTGKYKVSEIAYEVGFSSPHYFTRWFSQQLGESPTEFSERQKKS